MTADIFIIQVHRFSLIVRKYLGQLQSSFETKMAYKIGAFSHFVSHLTVLQVQYLTFPDVKMVFPDAEMVFLTYTSSGPS